MMSASEAPCCRIACFSASVNVRRCSYASRSPALLSGAPPPWRLPYILESAMSWPSCSISAVGLGTMPTRASYPSFDGMPMPRSFSARLAAESSRIPRSRTSSSAMSAWISSGERGLSYERLLARSFLGVDLYSAVAAARLWASIYWSACSRVMAPERTMASSSARYASSSVGTGVCGAPSVRSSISTYPQSCEALPWSVRSGHAQCLMHASDRPCRS